ncbi:MAG: hypothetical protein ACP5KN_06105 [Armatimonadota bacterium]
MLARSILVMVVIALMVSPVSAQEAVDIGSRLELFVDEFLVESMGGDVRLQLHHPVRREVVLRTDAPWEGNASAYQSVFKDGDLYRMYYRGGHYRHSGEPAQALDDHPWVLCYAESVDGIHWRRPELGLFEFNGSTANNIVLTPEAVESVGGDPAHTATFIDTNPDCPPDERYKIVMLGSKPRGLYALGSADGIHFSLLSEEPIMTEGAFDSQNLAFWDPVRQEYREYHRGFRAGVRDIMTSTSDDFLHFPEPQWLQWPGVEPRHLYTNQIQPYYRAPHIFMGFPMRYNDRGWSQPMLELPGLDERLARAKASRRFGTAVTDAVFMTSRDGLTFKRWPEAFIRPGPRERESWVYGDNFIFWQLVQTRSHLEDAPDEISLYATEGYWEGTDTSVRRYTIRIDGFVSASAPMSGGEIVTRPITFEGGSLALNLETSGAGGVQVELQSAEGEPIDGYALADCPPIFGDDLRHIVRWDGNSGDLRPLEGRPVRLRFVLRDADLYSFQFVPYEPEPDYPDLSPYGGFPDKNPDREAFVAVDDDFEGVPAGTSPTDGDLDPTEPEGTGWRVREGSADRVQVLNDAPPGSGQPGENQYVKCERREESAQQGGALWLALTPRDAADCERGTVELSARIFVPSASASRVDIDAMDDPPGVWTHRAFQARFWPDGTVTYYHAGEEHTLEDLRIAPDSWQEVAIVADLDAGTFDLTVDGRTAEGLPFAHEGVHRIQSIGFAPNTSNCTLYVDDVTVRIVP